MALYCVSCGCQQPEDNPPLRPGVVCVACQQIVDFTTQPPTNRWQAQQDYTLMDRRFLKSLRIAPNTKPDRKD